MTDPAIPTSGLLTDAVRKAYCAPVLHVTRRVAIYEYDGVTLWRPSDMQNRVIEGSVSVDSDRDERRVLDGLVLMNKDGLLNQDESDGFWYDKIIKIYRGLEYLDANKKKVRYETQIAEFMIDTINDRRFPGHVSITGRDYTKKLLLDNFAVDTSYPSGRAVDEIVRTVATVGGITKFRLGAGGATIGSTATFARASSRWEGIKSMCEGLNIEIYFDREGYLVTRPYDDVSTTAPSYFLEMTGSSANAVDYNRSSSDSNIFNHIVVIGTSEEETVTGYRWISQRENKNLLSPTCIQRIGRRTYTHEVNYLKSQSEADSLSKRLLSIKQLEDFELSFSATCIPWLEPGRVMEFYNPSDSSTIPVRFLYTNFSIPFGLGPMSGSAKRLAIIGDAR